MGNCYNVRLDRTNKVNAVGCYVHDVNFVVGQLLLRKTYVIRLVSEELLFWEK